MTFFQILLTILIIYILLTLIKNKLPWRICALCLAVSLTWAGLLAAYHAGRFDDGLLLGLLMGQSVTGIYHLLEERVRKPLLLFRLPFLLTMTYVFYIALTLETHLRAAVLLAGLWTGGLLLYEHRANPRLRETVKKIIACCGDW